MEWPRVTSILKDFGFITDAFYYEPRHRRRGRYADYWANELGAGKPGPAAEWYARKSGDPGKADEVEHEDCRPFIEAYMQFLRETQFTLECCAFEVRNTACRYVGHVDQLGRFPQQFNDEVFNLIDIKTGGESDWHKYQLGLYAPAVNETAKVFVLHRYNLYLTNDGKYRLVERKDRRDVTEALILAQAWWLTHGREK